MLYTLLVLLPAVLRDWRGFFVLVLKGSKGVLKTVVVMDYQNVHLTGWDVFLGKDTDAHHALIHPVQFARRAIQERNVRQREGYPHAEFSRVLAYRGRPHVDYAPEQNRRCIAQADQWEHDGAMVHLRDLKYKLQWTADGPLLDLKGRKVPKGPGTEKGIDVLVALACVRESQLEDVDLIILASRDSDLVPVLDEVTDMNRQRPGVAKIETVTWFDRQFRTLGSLRATAPRKIWNTNLSRDCFEASRDRNDYT